MSIGMTPKPMNLGDLLGAFRILASISLKPGRMFMTQQDAKDLGYYKSCRRCGGLVSPDPSYVHPIADCDKTMVQGIMDS
jgi:hypothetical protein